MKTQKTRKKFMNLKGIEEAENGCIKIQLLTSLLLNYRLLKLLRKIHVGYDI
jgi:hypothetical protein